MEKIEVLEQRFQRFIKLVTMGYVGAPDFDFDFIESECKDGESFEDASDRLLKEFDSIVKSNIKITRKDLMKRLVKKAEDKTELNMKLVADLIAYYNNQYMEIITEDIDDVNKPYYFKIKSEAIYIMVYAKRLSEAISSINTFVKNHTDILNNYYKIDLRIVRISDLRFEEGLDNMPIEKSLYTKFNDNIIEIIYDPTVYHDWLFNIKDLPKTILDDEGPNKNVK